MKETTKIPFRTAYSGQIRHFSPTGNGLRPKYQYRVKETGQKVLVKWGEINVYEEIQSYLEETKIENILKRVGVGDYSSFRPDGMYIDVTEMPNNLVQAMQVHQALENTWNNLPLEIRKKYDFDVSKFVAEAGTEAWLTDMGLKQPEKAEPTPIITEPETKPETPKTE